MWQEGIIDNDFQFLTIKQMTTKIIDQNVRLLTPMLEVVQGSKTRYLFHAAPTKDALWYPLQKIFWFCSKFDHKLLGTYTSLVQAVLSLAAHRTRSYQRSLSLTLLKKFFHNIKLDLFWHRLMVRREENMTTKKTGRNLT